MMFSSYPNVKSISIVIVVLYYTILVVPSTTSAFVAVQGSTPSKWNINTNPTQLYSEPSTTTTTATNVQDTPIVLPTFSNKDEYLSYMENVATLPQGFATGTADGKFISVEAPNMGPLPIRATIIQITNGPTNSWAAVYTKNKVPFENKQLSKL
jgi:hypothetical protein